MNCRRALFILILLLLSAVILYAEAEENLIENGDFKAVDGDGLPEGWYTDAYVLDTGYTVFSVKQGDRDHSTVAEINNIGNNDARFAQTVPVEPDSLYCLSGYIKAENIRGGHGANLSVEGVYAFSEKCYDTDGQWKYIEYYGETGPEQDYITVFARVGGYSGESTGKASFADLSLKKVDGVPGDAIADLWFREHTVYAEEEEDESEDTGNFRLQLAVISVLYMLFAVAVFKRLRQSSPAIDEYKTHSLFAAIILVSALALRMLISFLVEGYMVDVNCFLSWGHTMASVGPARFYEATNFCDYPPLYTYVLGICSSVSGILDADAGLTRVVFRFIPSVCDLAACVVLYRMLLRQHHCSEQASLLMFILLAFNPASVLNSAAWGQMDSVLCLLLLLVALYAVNRKWKTALPLYVVSVLIKPQALMLGPLGLAYIVISFVREPENRRSILWGTGFSLAVLAAGIIPFNGGQNWDWCIQLYARTLGSYPYATVNTANFYYLLGGNWAGVEKTAVFSAPFLLALFSLGYGIWWYIKAKEMRHRLIETGISFAFSALFILLAFTGGSWAFVGGSAMVFAFVIVLSQAVRSGNFRLLTYLGALLYILLYVFGVKMHERYIFPALLLLAASWVILHDTRILIVFVLFTVTLFINEGIVLDNSIRLGSALGHLNQDTVWIADVLSTASILGALYAVYLSIELFLGKERKEGFLQRFLQTSGQEKDEAVHEWKPDRSLHWSIKDTLILSIITVVYSCVSLLTLGSTKAPQTAWTSSSAAEEIVFDLGKVHSDFEMLYFGQVSRNDFTVSVSENGSDWSDDTWAQMDQGQCWKWKYVTLSTDTGGEKRTFYNSDPSNIVRFKGRFVKIKARQLGLTLNEFLFRGQDGAVIPAVFVSRSGEEPESELYSDPALLVDEQDTFEMLPFQQGDEETGNNFAQPSWWNSTYFDEIYHARTAFEFLRGTVPYETSHPPLGKVLMSAFVALFGMTPFGWRFAGAFAGILMLPGMYLLGKQLTKKTPLAVLSCLLIALDSMHLTQSQIATIDSFPVLFIIFAYFFMLRFLQTDPFEEKISHVLLPLCFSGVFMGLSIASKWIGIYAGAGLAVLFFWHCFRAAGLYRRLIHADLKEKAPEKTCVSSAENESPLMRRIMIICLWCLLFFVIIPVIIYLVSYIPYMAYNSRRIHSLWDYINEVWKSQVGMFNYHSTPNLGMDHPFYSPWWEWPIIRKPMYYAAEQYIPGSSPVHHSIFCFGNPVIWFGGLGALVYLMIRFVFRKRMTAESHRQYVPLSAGGFETNCVFLFIGLLAQYLPWVLVPRGTYIYHYFASIPFLMVSIVLCFDGYEKKIIKRAYAAASVLIVLAFAAFILLFPYSSGIPVSSAWLDLGKKILRIWY